MTITEKIIAAHAGKEEVRPGELVNVKLDLVLANDITAPLAIQQFRKIGVKRVFDPERVVLVPDHFTPNKDIKSAEQAKIVRDFAREQGLLNYFEVGRMGIEHVLLPEEGLVVPGDLMIGADSHTCTYGALAAFSTGVGSTDLACAMALGETWLRVPETLRFVFYGRPSDPWVSGKDLILYTIGQIGVEGARYKAMEFTGEAISELSMEGRLTMANMAIEAGAKNGIFIPDNITKQYVEGRFRREPVYLFSDPDAEYACEYRFDARAIPLMVAKPHLPSNGVPAEELEHVRIDQVVIGSCTNGRIEDLRQAAEVLRGRKVHKNVRCIVIPATQAVWRQALREGLLDVFVEAEAVVSAPTCGPCLGGHMGILAAEERAVSTTNRNFVGRMGHPASEVYLAGPYVAAASAVAGHIATPQMVGVTSPAEASVSSAAGVKPESHGGAS